MKSVLKKAARVLQISVFSLLALLLTVNAYLLIARFAFHVELPKLFGFTHVIVVSGSMEPMFGVDDILITREYDEYFPNDIVIFRSKSAFVTHRIVGVDSNGNFVTKGDANNAIDSVSIEPEQIEGKALYVVRGVGKVMTFLKSSLGMLILVLIGILLIEVPYQTERLRERRAERKACYDEQTKNEPPHEAD